MVSLQWHSKLWTDICEILTREPAIRVTAPRSITFFGWSRSNMRLLCLASLLATFFLPGLILAQTEANLIQKQSYVRGDTALVTVYITTRPKECTVFPVNNTNCAAAGGLLLSLLYVLFYSRQWDIDSSEGCILPQDWWDDRASNWQQYALCFIVLYGPLSQVHYFTRLQRTRMLISTFKWEKEMTQSKPAEKDILVVVILSVLGLRLSNFKMGIFSLLPICFYLILVLWPSWNGLMGAKNVTTPRSASTICAAWSSASSAKARTPSRAISRSTSAGRDTTLQDGLQLLLASYLRIIAFWRGETCTSRLH